MLKRINWKAIFKGFAWIVFLSGIVILMGFIDIKKNEVKCKDVKILIPGADNFIEREEIDAILRQGQGELIGSNLEQLNIHKIEQTIKVNPYIAFVKVYADMDGVVYVEIKQRQPILRIINAGGQDFYVDSKGLKIPMSPNFTANVLVATGNILEGFSGRVDTLLTPLAKDLYKTALYIKKDTLWDAQIEQVFVDEKNDIEFIPRVGNQRIILGNADSLNVKMTNLLAFYKQAMPKVGWNTYKTINLKYTNQIVCEKYDSLAIKKLAQPIKNDSTVIIKNTVDSLVKQAIQDEVKAAVKPEDKPKTNPAKEVKVTDIKEKTNDKAKANNNTTKPATSPVNNVTVAKPNNKIVADDKKQTVIKEKTDTKKTKQN
jgi:cell division protein FtsQ